MASAKRIRFLSIVALGLLVAVFVLGFALAVSNPGLVLLYVVCAAGLVAGGWLMLRSQGAAWWLGVVLTLAAPVGALVVTVEFFSRAGNLGRLLWLIALSAAYLAITGLIAREYWQARRAAVHPAGGPKRRPVLIINPRSGGGRAAKAGLADKARALGIPVRELEPGQDMVALAEAEIARGADVVGISGGDGSLGVLAEVAMRHDLPLVVLPGGTRCHFARDIGLDPEHIVDGLAAFNGVERRVDAGVLGGRVFLNNASFGLYAEIISHDEYRDHKLAVTNQVTRELVTDPNPSYPLNFDDERGRHWEQAAQVLVGVNQYETARLDELGGRKQLDGGVLQVIALRALDASPLQQMLAGANFGPQSPFSVWTTRTFQISHPDGRLRVGLDGESLSADSPVKMRILPRRLRLLVPAEGARSRPVKAISMAGAGTLWQLISMRGAL